MPAVNFEVLWPDGECVVYYSPSTVIHQFFKENTQYSLDQFSQMSQQALDAASERVRARFGYACTAASAELEKIKCKLHSLAKENVSGDVMIKRLKE